MTELLVRKKDSQTSKSVAHATIAERKLNEIRVKVVELNHSEYSTRGHRPCRSLLFQYHAILDREGADAMWWQSHPRSRAVV